MAEHIFTVPCIRGVVDRQTNDLSIHDVVEELTVTAQGHEPDPASEPGLQVRFHLVSLWRRSDLDVPEETKCRATIVAPRPPQPKPLIEMELRLKEHNRARIILRVEGIPYRGNGTYRIVLELWGEDAWTVVASIPIEVQAKFEPT